ncbi:ABC transporter ATP-binding protein [Subdoligranulum variabile]|uniref:ABC transporter, ATP-binding protein n=1 Tax=Subdoligranulum variabile DSM 15176 TaxID=411471 RepID=D1PNZ6_9FIRM|nr:ABC transporter ATP-binding protein [Subdoligranulum variabile]EFB75492.1 ABC transporter, ATP-binding protein [Subdoligranulum variabile DSM 15176]UWP68943.1 ABC transporter ATP-binding protein [Subdoligranulum variabile]
MDGKKLQARGLCKTYGKVKALDQVDLTLEPGHIYGLIGRNGAGKTTLLAALTAQLPVESGTVTYGGEPVWENEKALADLCFSRELSGKLGSSVNSLRVREYLKAGRLFYPHWDAAYAEKLVAQFGLDPKKRISAMSKGMMSALTIVLALASRAPITMMDEPVAGLDIVAREDFYRLLLEDYAATGRTFVISTHILEEAATVFERVLILKEGRLIEDCDTDTLLAQFCAVSGRDDAVAAACEGYEVLHTETLGRQTMCTVRAPAEEIAARGLDVDCDVLTLQKVFVALCGHEREGM